MSVRDTWREWGVWEIVAMKRPVGAIPTGFQSVEQSPCSTPQAIHSGQDQASVRWRSAAGDKSPSCQSADESALWGSGDLSPAAGVNALGALRGASSQPRDHPDNQLRKPIQSNSNQFKV